MHLRALASTVAFLAVALPTAARAESAIAPYITISDLSVQEGNSGTTAFSAQVSLSGFYMPIEFDVAAMVETADNNDFTFATSHVSLTPNGPAQTVSGVIKGDLDPEGDETFRLVAVNPKGTWYPIFSAGGRITILDDDMDAAPHIHVKGLNVPEGNQGVTTTPLEVRLDPPPKLTVTVDYVGRDGSAGLGDDFRVTAGTLTFLPGEVSKTIPVEILGDQVWERDESFTVQLTNPHRAVLADSTATITIDNDDAPVAVSIDDQRLPEETRGVYDVSIVVHGDHPFPPEAKVWVKILGGSARLGEDFTAMSQTLYPKAGSTSVSFPLGIVGDGTPECDEGFTIQYGALYTGDESTKTAHFLILDDDGGPTDAAACADPYAVTDEVPPDGGTDVVDGSVPPDGSEASAADVTRSTPETGPASYPEPAAETSSGYGGYDRVVGGSGCGCAVGAASTTASPRWLALLLVLGVGLCRRSRQKRE
jgi:MYXO-CTERM domain-containing protein